MICCWILYVCTLLSFFKDLGFVLAGSWVAVQFDRFIVWFLRYFREECLYSRNSLTLFLRPGPFLVSFPDDSRYQWGLSTLGTWPIPNLSMISGKCSANNFPQLLFSWSHGVSPLCMHLETAKTQGTTVQISEDLFLQSPLFSRTIPHYFRISGFWSLSSQFCNTIRLCLVSLPFSTIKNMPPGKKPSWLQALPHFPLLFYTWEPCIAYCPISENNFLISFVHFLIV